MSEREVAILRSVVAKLKVSWSECFVGAGPARIDPAVVERIAARVETARGALELLLETYP